MKKIIILGNGYVGNLLHNYLSTRYDVYKFGSKDVNYHSKIKLKDIISELHPHAIIGCYGFTGKPNIDQAETLKEECWHLNVNVPLTVSCVCAEEKIPYIHISSGCIYSGYEKEWNEYDKPNFGMFNESSFYSKTKHAFELISMDIPKTVVRIRMPFGSCDSYRNYINKILKYDTLINAINSRTCMDDFGLSMLSIINSGYAINLSKNQIVHAVNKNPLSTKEFIKEMLDLGIENKKWNLIPYQDMIFKAPRSNCVINTSDVISNIFREEVTSLRETLKRIKQK